MTATSEVGVHAGAGEAPAASQISCSRKVLKSKVVGHKSLGSTPRFPPPIGKNMGVDKMDKTVAQIIRKLACFSQQDKSIPDHLLGSPGPGDHGKASPILVQQKQVWVHSLSPMDLDDSDPEPTASDVLLGQHLNKTDQSQPTPCNSHEQSPVPAGSHHDDGSLVELEASQDELDELDKCESTEVSMEMSQDSQILKHQLHEKCKQVKKA